MRQQGTEQHPLLVLQTCPIVSESRLFVDKDEATGVNNVPFTHRVSHISAHVQNCLDKTPGETCLKPNVGEHMFVI